MTRKRGKSRVSSATKRASRFKRKYVVESLTRRPKILLPSWELYLRTEEINFDYLEVLLFPEYERLGIPTTEQPYYTAWAKRKACIGLVFDEVTQQAEWDILYNEFVTRGLSKTWLDELEATVDCWVIQIRETLLFSEYWSSF